MARRRGSYYQPDVRAQAPELTVTRLPHGVTYGPVPARPPALLRTGGVAQA